MQMNYVTKNRCYTNATPIKPQYVIVHSTGGGIASKQSLHSYWNNADVSVCAHGLVDDTGSFITLPLTYKGWHIGSPGNNNTVGFETCEPANIAYKDTAHTTIDTVRYNPKDPAILNDFKKRWQNAVDMAAYMCRELGLSADRVLSHAEAHQKGFASNHADTGHWFPLFGKQYDMDAFREAMRKALSPQPQPEPAPTIYRIYAGAFTQKANAQRHLDSLKADGFDAFISQGNDIFIIQAGAYTDKKAAQAMLKRLNDNGYSAYIS